MKNILIFGSTGFIGNMFLEILPKKVNLLIITRNKKKISKSIKKHNFKEVNIKNYKFISKKNANIFQELDYIINCAGAYPNGKNRSDLININYKIPKKIYNISLSPKKKFFINMNTMLKNNKSIYVKYKHKLSKHFKRKNSMQTQIIDLFISHLYGDFKYKREFINKIINDIRIKKNTINLTSCKQKRDFIHIIDFKKCILKILRIKNFNKNYNKFDLGSYKSHTLKKIVYLIKKTFNSDIKINFGYYAISKNDDLNMNCKNSFGKYFTWKPKIKIDQGIKLLKKNL